MDQWRDTPVSPLLWAVLPALTFALLCGALFLAPRFYDTYLHHEHGLVENLQALALLVALLRALRLIPGSSGQARAGWLAAALFLLFCLGEEINWGQVYLGFATPEGLARANKQGDFNLHSVRGLPTFRTY